MLVGVATTAAKIKQQDWEDSTDTESQTVGHDLPHQRLCSYLTEHIEPLTRDECTEMIQVSVIHAKTTFQTIAIMGLGITFHILCTVAKHFKFLWLQLEKKMEQFLAL